MHNILYKLLDYQLVNISLFKLIIPSLKIMEGFMYFKGKKVYLILKNKRVYSGIVEEVEDVGDGLIFITIIDKFNRRIVFTTGELEVMEEEK